MVITLELETVQYLGVMITPPLSPLYMARYWSIFVYMTNEGCFMVSGGVNMTLKPRPLADCDLTQKLCLWVGP